MRYVDCLVMSAGLQAVDVPNMKSRFSYAVARNKRLLEPIVKSLEEMVKPSDEQKEYSDERTKILRKYAKKDEDGNPIMRSMNLRGVTSQTYLIPGIDDQLNEFNLEMNKLKKKYKDAIAEQERKEKDYEEYLEQECEPIDFFMVPWKLVPESGLSQVAMDGVFFMIEPEEKEAEKPARKGKPKPAQPK